jgi:hypothetical protein
MMPTEDGLAEYALGVAQRTSDPAQRRALLAELDALARGAKLVSAFGWPSGFPPAVYRAARQRVEECWDGPSGTQ